MLFEKHMLIIFDQIYAKKTNFFGTHAFLMLIHWSRSSLLLLLLWMEQLVFLDQLTGLTLAFLDQLTVQSFPLLEQIWLIP
jgi:hypothetical protein